MSEFELTADGVWVILTTGLILLNASVIILQNIKKALTSLNYFLTHE